MEYNARVHANVDIGRYGFTMVGQTLDFYMDFA